MAGEWVFKRNIPIERIRTELIHALNDLKLRGYSYECREIAGVMTCTVSFEGTEIFEVEVRPTKEGRWGYTERLLTLEPHFVSKARYAGSEIERHFDKSFVIIPEWLGQQAGEGAVNGKERLPPGFPKSEKGVERAKQIWKIVKRLEWEFLQDFERGYRDSPTPSDTELIDAVNEQIEGRKFKTAKRIRDFVRWGSEGLLE